MKRGLRSAAFDALADRAGVTGRTAFSQAVGTVVCADMGPAHVRIITGHIKCGYRTGLQAGFCKAAVTGRGIKDGLPKLLCHRQSATQRQQQPIPLVNQHVQWGAVAGAAAQSPVIEWRVWWTIKRVNRLCLQRLGPAADNAYRLAIQWVWIPIQILNLIDKMWPKCLDVWP